jgi:hypothetical protein
MFDLVPRADATDALGMRARSDRLRTAARAVARTMSAEELVALSNSEGLTGHDAELMSLARRSLRMTSIDARSSGAWIRTDDDWLTPRGGEVVVAQIDLAAAAVHQSVLRAAGWLVLFVDPSNVANNSDVRSAHGVVVESPVATGASMEPMALYAELVMPRRWHEAVQSLGFDDAEADAYDRVRARLQEYQGAESEGDGGVTIAYHRLLGYPNETTGTMPSECVYTAASGSTSSEPRAAVAEHSDYEQWWLLAQISVGVRRRLYIWIRDSDLESGRFTQLCAFVR